MKRQAIGSSSSEETEQTEVVNGSKRLKLLNNESSKKSYEINSPENTEMDISPVEKSVISNCENQTTTPPENGLFHEDTTSVMLNEENNIEHQSTVIVNEQESSENRISHAEDSVCNGSSDEVVVQVTFPTESVSECENTSAYAGEKQLSNNSESETNPNLDVQNSESTDSFQSEGFEAYNSTQESNKKTSKPCASPKLSDNVDKESSFEVDEQNNKFDLENLPMSHIKVTELPGHTDVIYSVAADEDLVLSASGDTTVRVWSVERKSTISTFSGHSDCVTSLILLSQSQSKILKKKMSLTKIPRIAVTGSYDCHIKLWSVLEGKELASVYTFNGISCLGYLESECLIVVGTEGGKIELWDISSSKVLVSIHAHEDLVSDIKVVDNYIYSVSIDGTVKVWAYEEEDLYPVYTRKRKEVSSDKKTFLPTQWKTVAVSNNIMYLGDNSSSLKSLDWRSGRLQLFKNQNEEHGISECVTAKENMLFSTFYDSTSDIGGINVWKLPEMAYVCTLTGAITDVCCLAVVQKENTLRVVSGSNSLLVWDFDLTKPLNTQDDFCVKEFESLGSEVDEKSFDLKSETLNNSKSSITADSSSSYKQWCNVM